MIDSWGISRRADRNSDPLCHCDDSETYRDSINKISELNQDIEEYHDDSVQSKG